MLRNESFQQVKGKGAKLSRFDYGNKWRHREFFLRPINNAKGCNSLLEFSAYTLPERVCAFLCRSIPFAFILICLRKVT
jgi:hypothetical protein